MSFQLTIIVIHAISLLTTYPPNEAIERLMTGQKLDRDTAELAVSYALIRLLEARKLLQESDPSLN